MISDISKKIAWMKNHPIILKGIFRGIERETLRIKKNGKFAHTNHPYSIGSALTHKWITTDFSENLLEFITPKSNDINYLLSFLKDLHIFTINQIKDELIWPFSLPHFSQKPTKVKIAQYGNSNLGKMKNIYRIGLKNRYGDIVNTISGVHYNFSLPLLFWKNWKNNQKIQKEKDYVSSGYLHLIRNYYRFGWIIPYLFGASPAISLYLLKNQTKKFYKNKENTLYLPWSTSLRLSDLGYTSTSIIDLNIMFNDLNSYIQSLKKAKETISEKFRKIGLKDRKGKFKQLNTNILQMENELYTQIRPKINTYSGESLIDALTNRGIEYIEIRSLDINPFSSIGINKSQIRLLDLFLIWCALQDSPKMNIEDFSVTQKNWKKIIFEGRKPNQKIYINNKNEKQTLLNISKIVFQDLEKIAIILDSYSNTAEYQNVCQKKMMFFQDPELTYSAKCASLFMKSGIEKTGLILANKYCQKLRYTPFNLLNKNIFNRECINSHKKQKKIEKNDFLSFEEYINQK